MTLHGQSIVAGIVDASAPPIGGADSSFYAIDPSTGEQLDPPYRDASASQIEAACEAAAGSFDDYRRRSPGDRAAFLDAIVRNIDALGEALIERAAAETGLGLDRLRFERARTAGQLQLFARLIDEGSWVDARIDPGLPDRKPAPRPDLRRMLVPIGPVAVFGASNFPLAFSVPGGDTASALAAGCPVVAKAHPAHPGTSEMTAGAIAAAARATGMPAGVFSLIHGRAPAVSLALVRHPHIKAVGFTGSLRVGRALFDAAAARPEPIAVFAEMGSINPVFILPGALAAQGAAIAAGVRASVTVGVGQFCTNPGLIVGLDEPDGRFAAFVIEVSQLMAAAPPGVMLNGAIQDAFVAGSRRLAAIDNVRGSGGLAEGDASAGKTASQAVVGRASPIAFSTDADTFFREPALSEELFGPATVIVSARSREQVMRIAKDLAGHLTATIHGTASDLESWGELIDILQQKVGRLVFNGFPTGVEVSPAMQHGGPYPASTDPRWTSVGTGAIERFVRPICFQDFPQAALPSELTDENPRHIWRLVDGKRTRDPVPGKG